MPRGELVLCDFNNYKIKVLHSLSVKGSLDVPGSLWDVAANVVVTLLTTNQLQVIQVFASLKKGSDIRVGHKQCHGIDVAAGKIYGKIKDGEIRIYGVIGNLTESV